MSETHVASVIVVDDDPVLRATVTTALESEAGFAIVGDTGDPYEAFELWRTHRPDFVVLDEYMATLNGLAIAGKILADDPDQSIVMLTAHPSRELYAAASMLGVRDVVDKVDIGALPEILRRHATPDDGET